MKNKNDSKNKPSKNSKSLPQHDAMDNQDKPGAEDTSVDIENANKENSVESVLGSTKSSIDKTDKITSPAAEPSSLPAPLGNTIDEKPEQPVNADKEPTTHHSEKKSPAKPAKKVADAPSTNDPSLANSPSKNSVSKLAIFCLFLMLAFAGIGGWGFYYLHGIIGLDEQSAQVLASHHQDDVSAMQKRATQHSEQIVMLAERFEQANLKHQQTIELVQDKMLELAGRRPNDWLLAEANYLVKLAGRKLWQEKDLATATTLLTTADLRIAEMRDPSLIGIRKALASDIAMLQALPRDNSETLALKIDGLISQVDNLKLNMVKLPDVIEEDDTGQLSESPADWKENLQRMWHSFSDGFITVRRRNGSVEPLMSPKQQWYLEENLKSKLMQTQLAVYRQQQDAFEHSVELATRWIMQFFDRQDSTTEFMLSELDSLRNEQISINYPTKLASSNLIIDALLQRNIGYDNTVGR